MKREIGQRYNVATFGDYLLCQVLPKQVCLVHLFGGNRLQEPVHVTNVFDITDVEFMQMLPQDGETVKLIEA